MHELAYSPMASSGQEPANIPAREIFAAIFISPLTQAGVSGSRSNRYQLGVCKRFAAAMPSVKVVSVRIETRPACDGADRRQLQALIADAQRGTFSLVIVDRIRRLATLPTTAIAVVDLLLASNVRIVTALPDQQISIAAAMREHGVGD